MVGIHRPSHNFLLNEVNDLGEMILHNRKVAGGRKLRQIHHDPNLMKKCLANLLLGKQICIGCMETLFGEMWLICQLRYIFLSCST